MEWVTIVCLLLGGFFSLIAAIGLVRMPDLFMRMQAATKAGTLAVGVIMVGVCFYHPNLNVVFKAALIVLFLFLTAPVAAHLIARASYIVGVDMWTGSVVDELKGKYELRTHELKGEEKKGEK